MIYPNGLITMEKIQKMVENPKDWKVYAESIFTKEKVPITDFGLLREYSFCADYTLCYDYIGEKEDLVPEYKKEETHNYLWRYKDFQIRKCKDSRGKGYYELVKWRNIEIDAESSPSCFTLLYWDGDDITFVGDRPFDEIESEDIEKIWKGLRTCQCVVEAEKEYE